MYEIDSFPQTASLAGDLPTDSNKTAIAQTGPSSENLNTISK